MHLQCEDLFFNSGHFSTISPEFFLLSPSGIPTTCMLDLLGPFHFIL